MARNLNELEKNPMASPEIRKWAEDIMNFIFTRSQENLAKNQSIDTGFLLRSGTPPKWEGNKISFEYDAPYAMPVEYGQIPHPVSHTHLLRWVERKLHKKGKEAVRISYAIANKIKVEGVNPRPFIRPSLNEAIVRYRLQIKNFAISDTPGQEKQTTSE